MSMTEEQTRIEWLKRRRNSIGASEAAAILNLHPYHSPLSLYYEKTTEVPPSDEQNDYQEWGHLLEEPLAKKYQRVTKRKVLPAAFVVHPKYPFISATPDRHFEATAQQWEKTAPGQELLVSGNTYTGPLELKTADRFDKEEETPLYWQIQNQQQMEIEKADVGSFAILGPWRKFYFRDMVRNDAFIKFLIEQEDFFWNTYVVPRVPPPADGHKATAEALKRLYPKDTGVKVPVPADFIKMWEHRERCMEAMKRLEAKRADCENRIKAHIKDATFGVLPDGTGFSLNTTDRASFVMPATSFRVLRRVNKKIK